MHITDSVPYSTLMLNPTWTLKLDSVKIFTLKAAITTTADIFIYLFIYTSPTPPSTPLAPQTIFMSICYL